MPAKGRGLGESGRNAAWRPRMRSYRPDDWGIGRNKGQHTGRCTNEPLPGLIVRTGLTDNQLGRLHALVRAGQHPRVRLLSCAGQVAGQRGTVVAIGQPAGEVAEFIKVRMDRDGDVLPFAPHELHLLAGPAVDDALQPYSADGIWTGRGPVVP